MGTFKNLSTGTKLILGAGAVLFFSLFFTWQRVEVDYGRAGVAELALDGWDAWGLLIGLLVLATLALVVLTRMSEVELPEGVAWNNVIFGLAAAIFAVAVVKNLTDAQSTWASYGFVAVAGVVAAGGYLNWTEARPRRRPLTGRKRRGISSAA